MPRLPFVPRRVPNTETARRLLPDSKRGETPKSQQSNRTDIYTHFTTVGGTNLLYSADSWVKITLELKTAGPVSVGTSAAIAPVLSGKGILLDTDREFTRVLPKGSRIFIAAESVNRVNVSIEPIAWLEQLDRDTVSAGASVANAMKVVGETIIMALRKLGGEATPTSSSGKTIGQLAAPQIPPNRRMVPRLTNVSPPKKMR
jgi:hypothetical protein